MTEKWISRDIKAEFGSTGNVRFLEPSQVSMCDSEGNEVKCKCGRPSTAAVVGNECYQTWCEKCSPWGKDE